MQLQTPTSHWALAPQMPWGAWARPPFRDEPTEDPGALTCCRIPAGELQDKPPESLEDMVLVYQKPGLSPAWTLPEADAPLGALGLCFLDLLGAALPLGLPLHTYHHSPYRSFQNLFPKSFLQGAYQDLLLRNSDSEALT